MPKLTRTMLGWANDPTANRTSSMATNLRDLFCSAAPKATVRVALFLLASDEESEVMLGALEAVSHDRGVRVEVLLEDKPYTSPIGRRIRKRLAQFATLRTCTKGCRSLSPDATMHDKFVTVSDMSWAPGADSVLWTSSANWTWRQLRQYWQTGVLIYGDRTLTREFDARFESMTACGQAGGCGAWKPSVFGRPLPDAYRLVQTGDNWTDAGFGWLSGDAGSGTRVLFSPVQPKTGDPVVTQLKRYACTPEHRTVRLGVFAMSTYRGPVIAKALGQLRERGCDVQALISTPQPVVVKQKGVAELRAQGVATSCVVLMHDKFVYLDVVDRVTGEPRRVLWTGSQNFTGTGIYANDDTMITMEAELATGQRAADIRSLGSWYLSRWGALAQRTVPCT
jgi:phosphatidylserine/phosphatidylglycerophosphate/cardiolipin synthase-like enzyme